MGTNIYIVPNDVYGRTTDGRRFLIARAGTRLTVNRARQMGIYKEPASVGPAETKPHAPAQPKDQPADSVSEEHDLLGRPLVEVDATDSARDLAVANALDLSQVEGSGSNGRILKSDVEAHLEAQAE